MSITTALYTLLIRPLELLFEIIFALVNRVLVHPGLSIIFLSLAINILVLPLYRQADAMQAEERDMEKKLEYWVKHIKKTFTGDERYMMLQTYYRQNNYKPTDALKGSVSLLLEIPFFMAAYNFLSKLPILEGVSFGPIRDLSAPDAMLVIAGVSINVLPILMTVINLISSAIYTKGFPTKTKVQLVIMAALFLVLLYDSPSGLVFYWTLNNVFSLVKNIFDKMKNPGLVVSILSSLLGVAGLGYAFTHPLDTMRKQILMIVALLVLQLPAVSYIASKYRKAHTPVEASATDKSLFRLGCLFITVLTGVLIPSAVIHSSPEEFINTYTYANPLLYVLNSALLAAGLFLVWFSIFYMLANPAGKRLMGLAVWVGCVGALVNYLFFGKSYGTLSPSLLFVNYPAFPVREQLVNLAALAVVIFAAYLLWKFKSGLVRSVLLSTCIVGILMSGMNVVQANGEIKEKLNQLETQGNSEISIPLSRNAKNVVVVMMDRAISSYVPYMLNEKPELREQFAGFTYYPNTISFGGFTNTGAPALFGGYEYTPSEMNKRDTELLVDKHNEAMKVMPVLFDSNGYQATVSDPTYAGYHWIPDLSIYDEYPNIRKFNTYGQFTANPEEASAQKDHVMNRNFFFYSLFKTSPVVLQPTLYANGTYNEFVPQKASDEQQRDGLYKATGNTGSFMKAYAVLQNLPNITTIDDSEQNNFFMMSNDTTHEPMLLQLPAYEPAPVVDNTEYEAAHADRFTLNGETLAMETDGQVIHYHANMATFLQLGRWFDYLRENGVYDNTRIIIVADHGSRQKQLEELKFDDGNYDAMHFNPLLMVKDFNSKEFTTDETFMTNADVPTLATAGLIDDPVNPFTHKPINSAPKAADKQYISTTYQWSTSENNGTTYLPDGWVSVHDNIYDDENWEVIEPNHG